MQWRSVEKVYETLLPDRNAWLVESMCKNMVRFRHGWQTLVWGISLNVYVIVNYVILFIYHQTECFRRSSQGIADLYLGKDPPSTVLVTCTSPMWGPDGTLQNKFLHAKVFLMSFRQECLNQKGCKAWQIHCLSPGQIAVLQHLVQGLHTITGVDCCMVDSILECPSPTLKQRQVLQVIF